MNLKSLSSEELADYLTALGLPKYRSNQIFAWIYRRKVCSWEAMTDLPLELRRFLEDKGVSLGCLPVVSQVRDAGGAVKYLFGLDDGETVEAVYLPEANRKTVCFSTQVGCGMGCLFCATGQRGMVRNLTPAEIVEQPLRISVLTGARINSLVAMGQGEPLANYDSLLKAVEIINDPRGMGIGARHITVSTCGIIPGIERLAREKYQVNLAISLHGADDQLRDYLMPINRKYPLEPLLEACRDYISRTNRRITFEYTMIDGINDRPSDLANLIKLLSGMLCHVNLIPFNPVPNSEFRRSGKERIQKFAAGLNRAHIKTTVRKERGGTLAAACGQLQGKGSL
ncbi:MAG: 23S rRNA (adenine(2503)-C(2))-methyltransferase RlmN [Firmicutes bacterium]|nr:23S rRNA (adenine(2503)-C(2))-methyltransferase RlmN [Bacillota bacterium]